MSGVPMPPAAYWEHVPWWAFMGLLLVVAVVASPFAIQVLRGRGAAYVSREQAFAASRDGLERQRAEFLLQLQTSEREARAELARERIERAAERDRLEEDRDTGWELGRGMEDRAHWYRHELISVSMRFNALLGRFRLLLEGRMPREQAEAVLQHEPPAENPPRVPPLREVPRIKAG